MHSALLGLCATIPVAGRGIRSHLLYQVPAQGPYNEQSRSSFPFPGTVSPVSFLPSLCIFSFLVLSLLLEPTVLPVATSPLLASCQTPYTRKGSQSLLSPWNSSLLREASLLPGEQLRTPLPASCLLLSASWFFSAGPALPQAGLPSQLTLALLSGDVR